MYCRFNAQIQNVCIGTFECMAFLIHEILTHDLFNEKIVFNVEGVILVTVSQFHCGCSNLKEGEVNTG